MSYLRVIVQECKPGTVEMLTRAAEETLVSRLHQIPGFISYQVGKVDDRSLFAIGTFETRAGAEEMERLGAQWRKQYGKEAIVSARPSIAEVILDAKAEQYEAHPSP